MCDNDQSRLLGLDERDNVVKTVFDKERLFSFLEVYAC